MRVDASLDAELAAAFGQVDQLALRTHHSEARVDYQEGAAAQSNPFVPASVVIVGRAHLQYLGNLPEPRKQKSAAGAASDVHQGAAPRRPGGTCVKLKSGFFPTAA
ncbi:MAG TPA: hypothetical protein VK771_02365 [Acidimicrobiia bacterium]|nr:hypothetical protein [Acidimicrobiia bacterium]